MDNACLAITHVPAVMAFWLSALLLAHVFVGYPLYVWVLAKLRPQVVRKSPFTPSVTVVMAAHGAAEAICAKLENLLTLDYQAEQLNIIVACDGGGDATATLCKQFGDARIRVLEFSERRGKAACLNDAIAAARGEILLMTDVRQRLDPMALRRLAENFADPLVGAVSGELRLLDAQTGFARGVDAYWRYEKLIRQAESHSGSTVGVTGALYAMRRELFHPLPAGTVLDDVLIPMRIVAEGYRVVFEPLALAWDRPSQTSAEERKRKIRTLAGNYQLMRIAPELLVPRSNPLWFRFVSHKLLRLLAPWLMMLLLFSSVALAAQHVVYALCLIALLACAGLVLVGRLMPVLATFLPVRLATAFCYLNIFAAQALFAFARNRRLHLW